MLRFAPMNILAFAHGLFLGGAQVSTLEFFELLKNEANLRVMVCENAEKEFLAQLQRLNIEYKLVPCSTTLGIPDMNVSLIEDWLKWSNIVWITDIEFSIAPKVKRIRRVPIVAHLRSYPLLCPWWGLLYGMRGVCYVGCSLSRIIRCKQVFNKELSRLGIIGSFKGSVYQVLDLVKGPIDYFNWRRVVSGNMVDSIDGFIAVSNFVKRVHEALMPVEGKPIEVVYNPVTYPLKYVRSAEPREKLEENLIVYASGSNPVKGPHLALQALKLLLNEGVNAKLIMFGCRGSWVEEYARKLGVERSVIFAGRESFARLYETTSSASVVVMPSIWPEPFGRIPVEANRIGVMAVVTNVGGLPEAVVDGETGLLAEVHSVDLAKKIRLSLELGRSRKQIRETSLSVINPTKSLHTLLRFFETI